MQTVQKVVKASINKLTPDRNQEEAPAHEQSAPEQSTMAPHATELLQDGLHKTYMEDATTSSEQAVYTTSNGAPYAHPYESQRAGENGPLLLQDFHLIDLLSHFDREVRLS